MSKKVNRDEFLNAARAFVESARPDDNSNTITRKEIVAVCEAGNIKWPTWFVNDAANRVGRGVYSLTPNAAPKELVKAKKITRSKPAPAEVEVATVPEIAMSPGIETSSSQAAVEQRSFIPEKTSGYVPFGHFRDLRSIIKSGRFYPTYITGLSGNGKTLMVEQVCAAEQRECVRVNITVETDEDDLLGGFRMVNGNTVWHDGPVIQAMERGAILLLDEVDLGSHKMMCLQPILEGKPAFLKKVCRVVHPQPGFNIVATANTKGKGSDDGRFIGTNVMNEAFLERFSITFEQDYPNEKTEAKILTNVLSEFDIEDEEFVSLLVKWGAVIRSAFNEGSVAEIISTRRLVHICEAFAIFKKNREHAINLCLNRFDLDTKSSFMDLYKKIDETINPIKQEDIDAAEAKVEQSSKSDKETKGTVTNTSTSAKQSIGNVANKELTREDLKELVSSDTLFQKLHEGNDVPF